LDQKRFARSRLFFPARFAAGKDEHVRTELLKLKDLLRHESN
jgi:hypothetical protein